MPAEKEVAQMAAKAMDPAVALTSADEDLIDTLIAISVVARQLARKLIGQKKKGEDEHEQTGQPDDDAE